ncbi:hypothetical protein [Bradyrhizobium liaoningense]
MVDGVAKGIGDAFDFLQLDAIIYRCTGEHRINGWTNDKLPRWMIARNCIDGAEKQGLIVRFLAYILSSLPPAGTLHVLIVNAMPQAKDALPEVKPQVEEVRLGLERTRELLNDPAARSTIEESREILTDVERGISLLDGYKGLHDCLHSLQAKQISLLIASSARIASDSLQHDALREYKDQVRTQVQCARDVVDRLPDDATLRSVEKKWIDELDIAAKFLQKSLDDRNPNAARIGIIRMSRVLQFQPPRLNDLIVAAAKQLPLQKLSAAMGTLAEIDHGGSNDLANGQAALSRLDQAVRGRVAEHDLWQEIDKQIWVNARKKIQLAAAARLWKDSGQASGYLLNGSALAEAEKFAQEDRDIKDLVLASRTKVSAGRRNTWILVVIVALLAITGWLLIDRTAEQRKLAQLEAQRSAIIAERGAARDAAQVDLQEAKIRALTQELKSAKLSAPAEITETVPEAVVRDQAQARVSSNDPSSATLRGFIWLGSDAAPNLLDSGGAPVKPSLASVGGSYSVSKNLVLRTSLPSADYIQSDSAGIVPEQTTIKLVAAPVPYKRPALAGSKAAAPTSGAPPTTVQYWARIEVRTSDQPIVYVEYAAPDPANAQTLAQKLKGQGFRVPGVEPSDLAKGINEIHFYFAADKGAAERLSAAVGAALKELQWSGVQAPKVVDLTSQKGPRNFPGVLELWIDFSSVK